MVHYVHDCKDDNEYGEYGNGGDQDKFVKEAGYPITVSAFSSQGIKLQSYL